MKPKTINHQGKLRSSLMMSPRHVVLCASILVWLQPGWAIPNAQHRLADAEINGNNETNRDMLEKTRTDLEKLTLLEPKNEDNWVKLSDVCERLGDHDGALKSMDQVIALNPIQPAYYGQKAAIFARRKDGQGTVATLNGGLSKLPGNEKLLFFRATANEKLNRNDAAALDDLEVIMSKHPDFLQAYGEHAQIKLRLQEPSSAKNDYDKLIARIDVLEKESMQKSSEAAQTPKDGADESTATPVKALTKERAKALDARAKVERSMRDFEHACVDALEAHTREPKDFRILADLANMYFADERLMMAKTYFQELLKLAPKHATQTQFALASLGIAEGDYTAAGSALVESLSTTVDKGAQDYGQVYLALLDKLAPSSAEAAGEGQTTKAKVTDSDKPQAPARALSLKGKEWPLSFIAYLRGQLSQEELEKLATSNGQKTELHTYLGLEAMAKKDNDKAKTEFQWVDDNGEPDFLEYAMSRNILNRMQ